MSEEVSNTEAQIGEMDSSQLLSPARTPASPAPYSRDSEELSKKREEFLRLYDELNALQTRVEGKTTSKSITPTNVTEAKTFAQRVQLETEQKALENKLERALTDKKNLEKLLKARDTSISKLTQDIEAAQEKIKSLQLDITKLQVENAALLKEKNALTEFHTVSQMVVSKVENDRGRTSIAPEQSLDTIMQLSTEIKLKDTYIAKLQTEIKNLEVQIKKREKGLEKMDKDMKKFGNKDERIYDLECQVSEKQLKIDELINQVKTQEQIIRNKSQFIEQLTKKVEKKKILKEMKNELEHTIKAKEREIRDLHDEIRILQRANEKKDKEIYKLENSNDAIPVKSLEGDKRFLTNEVARLKEQQRLHEKTIASQNEKIAQLESRLKAINLALKDSKLSIPISTFKRESGNGSSINGNNNNNNNDDEARHENGTSATTESIISEELLTVLQRDVELLRESLAQKDLLLGEKDTLIESLEKKVDILNRSKVTDAKVTKAKIRELQDQVAALNQKLVEAEENFKQRELELKKEKFSALRTSRIKTNLNSSIASGITSPRSPAPVKN